MGNVNHTTYIRNPFEVEAVQVSPENIEAVSEWCNGSIQAEGSDDAPVLFIKVWVARALNERQTKAYFDDWVLYAGTGFKVYTDRAFRKTFSPKIVQPQPQPVQNQSQTESEEEGIVVDSPQQ